MQLELHFEFPISRKYAGIQTMTRCGCQNNLSEMPVLQNMILDVLSDDPLASVSVELDGIAFSTSIELTNTVFVIAINTSTYI